MISPILRVLTVACFFIITSVYAADIPGTNGIPDLTKGGVMTRCNLRWAGPVGIFCGSWRPRRQKMEDVRQFQVLSMEKGSPADGVLKIDDVILGADGTGAAKVPLFKGAGSPMQEIGDAITEAEAHDPAILKLLIWRPAKTDDKVDPYRKIDLRHLKKILKPYTEGKTMTVSVKLETLGRYSDTAPYNCEKSKNILRKGIKALYESNDPGRFSMGILCLLAADDPTNPDNDKYQARAKEWARKLIIDRTLGAGWQGAVELAVLSEYYLKTRDEAVLPELEKRALSLARGVSWFGTFGHRSADRKPDGSYGGRIGGYGPINGAGTWGFMALSLARKAGIKNPEVDAANERQRKFFGHYAFHGGLPYGEMPYAIAGSQGDRNGVHAMTALGLGLQEKQEEKAKYFTKMTALSTDRSRQYAHGGPFFGQVWQPVGAAQGGVKAAHMQFNEIRWHLDLKRSWNGSFIYDPTNNKYGKFCYPAHSLLFYALPLKQLYVTGRGQKEALKLSDAEFKELQAVKTFDPTKLSTQELFAELSRHDGMTRGAVAKELVERIKKDPESAESGAIVDRLVALVADKTATTSARAGAFTTLMFLKRKSGDLENPQDLKIVKTMVSQLKDPDPYMRFGAVRMMQAFNGKFTEVAIQPYANEFFDAIIATDRPTFPLNEENPVRWAHGEMCSFVFGTVLRKSLEGVDHRKMLQAIRSALRTPNGNNRYFASRIFDKLTKDEVLAVADILVDNTKIPPPANSMGGSAIPNTQKTLAKHLFEEGLPLSLNYDAPTAIKYKIHEKYGKAAFAMQYSRDLVKSLGKLMLVDGGLDAPKILEQMKGIPAPKELTKLKEINTIKAVQPTLTLPTAQTELVLDAINYADPDDKNTTYTWRKVYGAGKVNFTPNASGESKKTTVSFKDNKPGKYSFEVTMTDALGYNTLRKSVDVTLYDKNGKLPSNRPPTAASQSLKAVPGLPLAVNLAGTDPDGDDLGFIVTEKPAHGRLSGTGGSLTYTPDFGYNGIDKLVFQAIDGQGMASTGTIKFNISDKDVGVAVYEGFDYPPGPIEKRGGEPSFGFKGPWTNTKGTKDFYLVTDKSSSYSSLPSTGGKLMKGKGWWPLSRRLNPKVMSEHKLLDNGGELWFSMFMTPQKSNSYFDFTGKDISFGFRIDGFSIHTTLNGEKAGESKQAWSRSAKLRFPDGPHMIIGHCVWGKTDTDPDTIKIYRVFDTPESGPIVIDRPACIMKEVIIQSKIDQISMKDFEKGTVDEIRIGPTLNSVMIGTKPLKVKSGK